MTLAGIQAIGFSLIGVTLLVFGKDAAGSFAIIIANIWAAANYLESRR